MSFEVCLYSNVDDVKQSCGQKETEELDRGEGTPCPSQIASIVSPCTVGDVLATLRGCEHGSVNLWRCVSHH